MFARRKGHSRESSMFKVQYFLSNLGAGYVRTSQQFELYRYCFKKTGEYVPFCVPL